VLSSFLLLMTASVQAAELPSEVAGPARVEDGDTLTVGRSEVRLFGIDAPEMDSGDGHFARAELEDLISGQEVRCKVRDCDGVSDDISRRGPGRAVKGLLPDEVCPRLDLSA